MKFQIWIGLLALGFAVACQPIDVAQQGQGQGAAQATVTPIPTAQAAARTTYTVQRGDVVQEFTFRGRWLPRDQQELSFEVNGSVRAVNVNRNDTVTQGELLADLQIDELEDRLIQAQLNLEAARRNLESGGDADEGSVEQALFNLANTNLGLAGQRATLTGTSIQNALDGIEAAQRGLENAQRDYNDAIGRPNSPASTVNNLYEALIAAEERLLQAERTYFDAVAQFYSSSLNVQSSENNLLQAQRNLQDAQEGGTDPDLAQAIIEAQLNLTNIEEDIAKSSLVAPFDGVVLEVLIRPGDPVEAFNAVLTLAIPQPLEAIAEISPNDYQNLQVGQVGVCEVANQPETAVQCLIRQLPLTSRDVDQTVRVAASLPDVPSGTLIDVTMTLEERLDVLYLPPQAINEFGNRTFVVLQTPDGERVQDVTLGLRTEERVEIETGLEEGAVVVQS